MFRFKRFRLSALLATIAVVAATVVPALPATAEDVPTPSPQVTDTPTPTPDPTDTPTPDPTDSPSPAPTGTPSPEPSPAPTHLTPPPAGTVDAAGVFTGTLVATVSLGSDSKLTAVASGISLPAGTITYKYQWMRKTAAAAAVAIAGATTAVHPLVAADYNTSVFVHVTATSTGITTAPADSVLHNYSVVATPAAPVLVGEQRVGVDLTVPTQAYALDGSPASPTVSYSWYRDGVLIPGTTGSAPTFAHYTPTSSDAGKAITVKATASVAGGFLPSVGTSLPTQKLTAFSIAGYDTVLPDVVKTPGTLVLTLPGTAVTEPGVTTAYQWLRNGVAIAGATHVSYTMTAADAAKLVSVRVKISKPLYTTAVKVSPGINYSIQNTEPPATPFLSTNAYHWQVGATANVYDFAFQTKDELSITGASYAYQWLRNGAVIAGATHPSYTAVAADFGTTTTVRLTASKAGYLPLTIVVGGISTPFKVETGVFSSGNGFAAPIVANSSGLLHLVPDPLEISDPNPVYNYAWLHDGTTVVGTKSTYQLSAADYGHAVSLRVTVTKPFFTPRVLPDSAAPDNSIYSDAARVVSDATVPGEFRIGHVLTTNVPNYRVGLNPMTPSLAYQWFRKVGTKAPVAITGATAATYIIQSVDLGASLSVRVTASDPFDVAMVETTAQAGPVVGGIIGGSGAQPTVSSSVSGLLTVALSLGSVDMPDPTLHVQWMRVDSPDPVLLATSLTYQLTTANNDDQIFARVSVSKAGSLPALFPLIDSQPHGYSIAPQSAAQITPGSSPHVGDVLGVMPPTYLAPDFAVLSPAFTYQWFRQTGAAARVKITGATGATYTVTPADYSPLNTQFTVDITARADHYIANTLTSSVSSAVLPGEVAGDPDLPVVNVSAPAKLTATLLPTTVTTPGVALAYKWYRNGAAITGATASTYALTAADYQHDITVVVTATKPGFTPRIIGPSLAKDYSLQPSSSLQVQDTMSLTGEVWSLNPVTWASPALGSVTPTSVTYQWYRKVGSAAPVAIAGATHASYELAGADLHASLSVKVTAVAPSTITAVITTAQSSAVAFEGNMQGSFTGGTVAPNGNGKVKVDLPGGWLTTTGTNIAYQWLRNGATIPGATGATYTPVAADASQPLSVHLTITKSHLITKTIDLGPRDVSITQTGAVSLAGAAAVGSDLTVDPATWANAEGAVTPSIQWLRKVGAGPAVVIAGQTGLTYHLKAVDLGATISARVTVAAPGSIGMVVTTAPTVTVVKGTFTGTFDRPLVTAMSVSLIGSLLPGSVDQEAGATVSYQWLRDTQPIAGKTSAEYFLSPADYGHAIALRVNVSAPGFNVLPAGTIPDGNGTDYSLHVDSPPILSGPTKVGEPLTIAGGTYIDTYGPAMFVTTTYKWYRYKTGVTPILISGQTGISYTPTAADLGYSITGRVTYGASARVGSFVDAHAGPVVKGDFTGSGSAPGVASIPGDNVLAVSIEGGTIDQPTAVFGYQWQRSGVNIPGATKATYKLVPADWGHGITFVTTVTAPGYNTLLLTTPPDVDVSITADSTPTVFGVKAVGGVLSLAPMTWSASGSSYVPTLSTYQWLRDNVAITGATAATYAVQPADVGHTIKLRFTTSGGSVIGRVETTAPTPTIAQGAFSGTMHAPEVTEDKPTMTLTGALAGGSVDQTGLTLAYQWLRNGANIAAATKSTYKLVALDKGANIQVRITFSKAGYAVHAPLTSNLQTYTLGAATTASIQAPHNPPRYGDTLISNTIVYDLTPSSITFQWYQRTGATGPLVPIVGNLGTGSTYHVVAGDVGKFIVLQVTATYPGYFSNVQTAVSAALPIDP